MQGKVEGGVKSSSQCGLKSDLSSNNTSFFSSLSLKSLKLKMKQQALLIRVTILGLVYVLAFISRLFSVLCYESMIHEFESRRRLSGRGPLSPSSEVFCFATLNLQIPFIDKERKGLLQTVSFLEVIHGAIEWSAASSYAMGWKVSFFIGNCSSHRRGS